MQMERNNIETWKKQSDDYQQNLNRIFKVDGTSGGCGGGQGRAICIGYCIVFTILISIGFTQYLLWVLVFFQYNTIQQFFF